MLPYPNLHHFSQEPFHGHQEAPNPPPTSDHDALFFPTYQFPPETLEALLQPAVVAVAPVAAGDRETVSVSSAGALPPPRSGGARARKRPFRTDRHSKIRTAQGVRDRRMRLSLDVAREFFALQDRLGFDKASQTVDWLLTQSKPAIDRLTGSPKPDHNSGRNGSDVSMSSTSECGDLAAITGSAKGKGDETQVISKDARQKARDRARERTMEKMRRRGDGIMEHASELERLVSASLGGRMVGADHGMDGVYYYLGEMLNGIEEDDDADEELDGDFLDGMKL